MSNDGLPDPLVPPDADMRGLPFMPLDVVRLMDSDLFALSTGDEFKAAVAAWCKSWLQLPAGSLPDDDRVLAHLTGAGARWRKVKEMALHGFIRCSDGRFYHPVVCEKVLEGMERRAQYAEEREADRERLKRWRDAKRRKRETRFSEEDETDMKRVSPAFRNGDETPGETEVKRLRQGQGQGHYSVPNGTGGKPPPSDDPVKEMFDRGVAILGEKARGLLGKAKKEHGELAVLRAIGRCEQERPIDPAAFFVKALDDVTRRQANRGVIPMHPGAGG